VRGGGGGVARRGVEGVGKRERERERERGGELTSGSKSGDHHLQNLGHHGERERWRIGGCCAGKSNERKGEKGGGVHRGGTGARGAPGQAGPGRAGSRAGTEAHNTRDHISDSNREPKSEMRRDEHAIKHDIRQRNMLRHDATPMTT
jgi:hypothetical protein